MGNLIDLNYRYQRRQRPPKSALAPWAPGQGARRLLEYLVQYRFLTRELLALLVEHEHGRGAGEVRNHLTRLYRYGYVERFFRATEYGQGSRQYVYTATGEGARLVLDAEAWETARWRVRNLLKPRRDYEHALAVGLLHVLWNLASEHVEDRLRTWFYWQDKEGEERGRPKNRFTVRVGGGPVVIDPDSTVLTAQKGKREWYARPVFLEVERTHKNAERLVRRFEAYKELIGEQAVVANRVFGAEIGKAPFVAEKGMVVFLGADASHCDRLRELAVTTVGKGRGAPEFWFVALEDLLDARVQGNTRSGKERMMESILPPAEFFTREFARRLDGRWGSLLSTP